MTADTSWSHCCRSWVAPPPAWVPFARDRDGQRIGTGPLLLLVHLWTLADAPSKRERGHATIAHRDVLQVELARAFDVGLSTLKGWEKTLREAGLLARPSEGVVTLADVAELGYLDESTPGIRTGGVSTAAPAKVQDPGPQRSEFLDHAVQESGPPRSEFLDPRGLNSWTSEVQDPGPPLRKPDHSRSDPDQALLSPDSARAESSEYQRAREWCLAHNGVGQIARMQSRWLVELNRRMLGPDGLTFDEVVRIVVEHERQTSEARRAGTLREMQAANGNAKHPDLGIPELGRLWLDWSKATTWRANALRGASDPAASAGGDRMARELEASRKRRGER